MLYHPSLSCTSLITYIIQQTSCMKLLYLALRSSHICRFELGKRGAPEKRGAASGCCSCQSFLDTRCSA